VLGPTYDENYQLAERLQLPPGLGKVVFSSPARPGDYMPDEAGSTLAIEFVAVLANMGHGTLVKDDSNFYVELQGIGKVGIYEGELHNYTDLWPHRLDNQINLQLIMPRGVGWTTRQLGAIDRVYFWCNDNPDKLNELEAVLDALAYLKAFDDDYRNGLFETQLLNLKPSDKIKQVKAGIADRLNRIVAAQELMQDFRVPDQAKLATIFELLVPMVVTEKFFNARFWNMHNPIYTLRAREVSRIENQLEKLKNKG
jgi:hypothetical protein